MSETIGQVTMTDGVWEAASAGSVIKVDVNGVRLVVMRMDLYERKKLAARKQFGVRDMVEGDL